MNENENFEMAQDTPEVSQAEQKADAQKDFLDSLKNVNSSYFNIVMVCACIAICGIVLALHVMLWLGVGVAFSSAIVYMLTTKALLRKQLGISYESTSGALTVTKISAKGNEEIFVPRRLLWLDVTTLADGAFSCEDSKNMRAVHLPATLNEIGKDVFEGCDALEAVYFEGTQEDFEKIESSTDFGGLKLIFCDSAEYEIKKQKKEKKNVEQTEDVPDEKESD